MNDINELSNNIYNLLKGYITDRSKYEVEVLKNVKDNKYPLVVFETNTNMLASQTKDRVYQTRNLSFEISIFAITINNIDSSIICDELAQLTTNVMQGYFAMQGGIDAKLKNINTAKATKYVLHFNCEWFMLRNMIF